MVSANHPPDQAANALLPQLIGDALTLHGVTTSYVTYRSTQPSSRSTSRDVVSVPRRGRDTLARTKAGALAAAARIAWAARRAVRQSDLVHLHSNGLLIEVGGRLATTLGRPYVITLYGTDVWHHDPGVHGRFARTVREAAYRIFYSESLRAFAAGRGLANEPCTVIHAPVPDIFQPPDVAARQRLRSELGIANGPLLLTVKRLHPVAGHEDLLRAFPIVLRKHPGAALWLVGEGELRPSLEALAAELGIASRVRFVGLLDNAAIPSYCAAADLFVLPSRLESWGTVMLEALASGTPVVATDTAGGVEVHTLFPRDVTLTERENPRALAAAILEALVQSGRVSSETLRRDFSVQACALRYLELYNRAVGGTSSQVVSSR
jgi:glycosyltransferase involved in cell wall biosynthesis